MYYRNMLHLCIYHVSYITHSNHQGLSEHKKTAKRDGKSEAKANKPAHAKPPKPEPGKAQLRHQSLEMLPI